MVGIVIVSHSKKLAEGVIDLVKMNAKKVKIEAAGGLENEDYGVSLNLINQAIEKTYGDDGVLILCDLGSSIMTSEMAVELNSDKKIILNKTSLVEGAFAASIYAENDLSLEEINSKINEEINK